MMALVLEGTLPRRYLAMLVIFLTSASSGAGVAAATAFFFAMVNENEGRIEEERG